MIVKETIERNFEDVKRGFYIQRGLKTIFTGFLYEIKHTFTREEWDKIEQLEVKEIKTFLEKATKEHQIVYLEIRTNLEGLI